jgi:hypothetical protein
MRYQNCGKMMSRNPFSSLFSAGSQLIASDAKRIQE